MKTATSDAGSSGDAITPMGSAAGKSAHEMVVAPSADRDRWTRLTGIHGPLWVDSLTGEPRAPRAALPGWYPQIERVDWADYLAWKAALPAGLMIEHCLADFGIQYVDGTYEPAEEDSRSSTLDQTRADEDGDSER